MSKLFSVDLIRQAGLFVLGVGIALVFLLPSGLGAKVEADESQCPPPPNCAFFTCYKPIAGPAECKFIALENGAQCHVGGACSPPEGD